ncbi:hypothetical protein CCM_08501 [Cordyceps militaris CM01]|uniref:Uncharacterized protein n=1 Tax=Cordyceps militaris (strain CM01) TaxID=983644 RepID=G3JRR7_CORMM|nr:uncharacterized protein CCM_08501 [Cordyceps militaris CM01]EGX88457.1 hypothetical protein CCM_08501 [Cordyceps militaris CM01]
MNWSNGQLARQSRRSYNNDATKQKHYFAQAKRQKVTESRKRKCNAADFVPSYLEDLPETLDRPSRNATRHWEPKRRILTLQDMPLPAQQATDYSNDDRAVENLKRLHSVTGETDPNLDVKRRKLLQQSDWSGVELQKPVIIKYPETARAARKVQRHISHDQFDSPLVKISKSQIPADTVIKIASQEYRWSPGNNSIRTWHSKEQKSVPETPMDKSGPLYDISSSTSKSFSSFIPESPCAERALQIGRAKAGREPQLQSVSHTSPSIFDEPLVKAVSATHYFHPQPIRHMPQGIFARLADFVKDGDVAVDAWRASPSQLNDTSSCVAATESKSGDSIIPETVKDSSSKISESPRRAIQSSKSNPISLSQRNLGLAPSRLPSPQAIEAVHDETLPKAFDSLPSSITTPDVCRIAEASHAGNRLSALPYLRPAPTAPDIGDEDENIMWKRFVLGPGRPTMAVSAEQCSSDTPDDKRTSKLGVEPATVEAPTSRLEITSPVLDSRRLPGPTPAPAGPTPPLAISADGGPYRTGARLSNKHPQTPSDDAVPVYFREQRNGFEAMTALPTEAPEASHHPLSEVYHMTAKPESTFHPPSLFVGRLAASISGGAVAPTAAPSASEPEPSSITAPKAPSARVMSRRRRKKRREAGRPDIRALPNIQGDPIEFTP